jgi:hypothetical protein
MSFGLQENIEMGTGNVNGYQFPMCLWNKNGPSLDETKFVDTFNKIVDYCKKYLVDNRDMIEKYDLEMNDLKKFDPLYYKMEKGKVVEGKGPMFYIKTMSAKTNESVKIKTVFTDDETNELINPMDLMNKRCYVQGAIKFESIFIGNKISIQAKLFEARVRIVDTAFRSLLNPSVVIKADSNPTASSEEEDDTSNISMIPVQPQAGFTETGSLIDEEEEEEDEEEEEEDEEEEEAKAPPASVNTTPSAPTTPVVNVTSAEEKTPKKRGPAPKKK